MKHKDRLFKAVVIGATPAGIAAANKMGELGVPVTLVDAMPDLDRKLAADAYVFAVPMWNYMIPYRLKQYIDCITQPTYTFTIVDGEYQGLCDGRVFVGYARGNAYPEGAPRHAFNLQSPYFEMWLGFVGLTDVTTVAAEATLAPPETADAALQQALRQADEAGRGF